MQTGAADEGRRGERASRGGGRGEALVEAGGNWGAGPGGGGEAGAQLTWTEERVPTWTYKFLLNYMGCVLVP